MPEIHVDDPHRAVALAVIARAMADAIGDDQIAGDEREPGVIRRDAFRFFRRAAAGDPDVVWLFQLARLDPCQVLRVAETREKEARRAAGKALAEQMTLEALEEMLETAPPRPRPEPLPPRKPAGRTKLEQMNLFEYSTKAEVG